MVEFWHFIKPVLYVFMIGSLWIFFVLSLVLVGIGVWSLIKGERGGEVVGPFMTGVVVFCIGGFILWQVHGGTVSNWFLSSPGMFGKDIGGYEQEYLDEQHPPKHKDGRIVDCWEWRYRKEDGRYIVPITVPKPLDYFTEYNLHLLPQSKRSFLISGNRFGVTKETYDEVKSLLISKYGKPIEENENTCSFRDGKKKIGLVFTDILGKRQLYINAYRDDLLTEQLPSELHELKEQRRQKKLDSL